MEQGIALPIVILIVGTVIAHAGLVFLVLKNDWK